jgi:hypothetical protein
LQGLAVFRAGNRELEPGKFVGSNRPIGRIGPDGSCLELNPHTLARNLSPVDLLRANGLVGFCRMSGRRGQNQANRNWGQKSSVEFCYRLNRHCHPPHHEL